MAIQKMIFFKIVGSIEDMHQVLQRLILSEKLHFDVEHADVYDNSYIVHEFESVMAGPSDYMPENIDSTEVRCEQMEKDVEELCHGLGFLAQIDKSEFLRGNYSIQNAKEDLDKLSSMLLPQIRKISEKKVMEMQYREFKAEMDCINPSSLDIGKLSTLNYFDYEMGSLSKESRFKLRQNYENISSVVMKIGRIKESDENIQLIVFPKQFRDESLKLLKSLNWTKLEIPDRLSGTVRDMIEKSNEIIQHLSEEINTLTKTLYADLEVTKNLLDKIYTSVKLEKKILSLEKDIDFGESTFVLNAWVKKDDREEVRSILSSVSDKLVVEEKTQKQWKGR